MILTEQWLKDNNACQQGIYFVIKNNLIGFPLNLLDDVDGDYLGFISWLRHNIDNKIGYDEQNRVIQIYSPFYDDVSRYKYDDNDNIVEYSITADEKTYYEYHKYDNKNRKIKTTNSNDEITLYEYDDNDNTIKIIRNDAHFLDAYEFIHEYDDKNRIIHTTTKEIQDKKPVRTDETWYEYDYLDRLFYTKYSSGQDCWMEFDVHGNVIKSKVTIKVKNAPILPKNDQFNTYSFDKINNTYTINRIISITYYDDGQLKQCDGLSIPYFEK